MAETHSIETTSDEVMPLDGAPQPDSTTDSQTQVKRKYKRKPNRRPPGRPARPLPLPPERFDADEDELEDKAGAQEAVEAAIQAEQPDDEHEKLMKADLFYWLDNLSDETWQQMMVYVYRKEPIWLQDKAGGKPHYVAKLGTRFSIDDLKRMQGSGVYRIDVTIALPTGGSRRMRTGEAHIMDPQYPPNLPVSDAWTSNPQNARWFWAIPLLERREQEQGKTAPQAQARPASAPASAPTAPDGEDAGLIAMARRSQEQLMELTDPKRQLSTMREMLELVRPPASQGSDNMMLEFMREELRSMREELKAARQAPPQKDARTMLTETIELAQLLGFRKGGGQVETDPWANFLEKVVDAAPAIAEMILSTRQAQPPQQQQQQPQQAATIPPPPAEEAEDEEEEGDQPQVSKKEQDIMTRLEPVIRTSVPEMIRTVNAKEPAALRKWFLEEHGRSSFELLKAHLGPERMAEMATTHPAIRPMVPSKPVVLQFFEAVFAE